MTLTAATGQSVKDAQVFINGASTGATVTADNRDGTLTLSTPITYAAGATVEFRGAVPTYLSLLESTQTPARAVSGSVAVAPDADPKKLKLGAAASAPVTGYKVFINGVDTGALVVNDDRSAVLSLDKSVSYSAGDTVEFRYPFNGTLFASLDGGAFSASNLRVAATSQASQFAGFDATAATRLEGLRGSFNTPVTAFTSGIASTLGGWNQELKLNQTLERSLSDQKASISGVNLDEEAANLVRYQQLYAAASKMVQMGSQMFDTLLAMMSGR
jgi:flagellar hook-associated protein FlgK